MTTTHPTCETCKHWGPSRVRIQDAPIDEYPKLSKRRPGPVKNCIDGGVCMRAPERIKFEIGYHSAFSDCRHDATNNTSYYFTDPLHYCAMHSEVCDEKGNR